MNWLVFLRNRLFPKGSFLEHVGLLAGGSAFSHALMLLSAPLLARLFSPHDFGLFGLVISFIYIASTVTALRLDIALVSVKDNTEARSLAGICGYLSLPTSLLSGLVLFLLIRYQWLGFGACPSWVVWPSVVTLIIISFLWTYRYVLLRHERFLVVSRATVLQGIVRILLPLGVSQLGFGWLSLLIGEIAGRLVALAFVTSHLDEKTKMKFPQFSEARRLLKKYRSFPLYVLPSNLVENSLQSVPIPLIAHFYGTDPAGQFLLVQKMISAPASLLSTSVAEVFHSRMSALLRNQPGKERTLFWMIASRLFWIGIGPTLFVSFFGEYFANLLFGPRWQTAGVLCSYLAPWVFAVSLVSPLSRITYLFGAQRTKLIFDLLSLVTTISALLIGGFLGWDFFETLRVLIMANVTLSLLFFVLIARLFPPQTVSTGKKPSVAHLTSVHYIDDNRIFNKQCLSLKKSGYAVTLVGPTHSDMTVRGVDIAAVHVPSSRFERFTRTLWNVYRKAVLVDARVYHFHDPELMFVGLLLKTKGKKVIYDVHEDYAGGTLTKEWIPKGLRWITAIMTAFAEKFIAPIFDGIVAATPSISRKFPTQKTITVQNFPRFEDELNSRAMPYLERSPILSFTGVMSELRGIRFLVKAMGYLPEGLGAALELVGRFSPDEFKEELKKEAGWRFVNAREWVSREELAVHIGHARIGAVLYLPAPNHVQAQPQKMFEYMSAAIPVIVSHFPLWKDIVESVGCGFCVAPSDPKAIADKLEWLLTHPEKAMEMGELGRRAISERYSWASEEKKLIQFYNGLCFTY